MAAWFAAFIRGGDDDIAKRRRITANLSLSFQRQPGDSCTRFTRANDFSCFASHREKPKPKKGNSRLFHSASVSLFFFFFPSIFPSSIRGSFRGSFSIEDLLFEISVPLSVVYFLLNFSKYIFISSENWVRYSRCAWDF